MKLTAKQNIYFGALAMAAGAFAVDRCFFTPAHAAAKVVVAEKVESTTPVKKNAASPSTPRPEELTDLSSLAARLAEAAAAQDASDETRDPFQPSPAWTARIANSRQTATSADQFRAHHRLTAILSGPQTSLIIVDGKTLAIGQQIGTFRLTKVTDRTATFDSPEGTVELQLPK